jgi:aspartate ammonia-lyase
VANLNDLARDLQTMKRDFNRKKPKFMKELGNGLKAKIQSNTPVDSGRLINSYKVSTSKNSAEVSSTVDYAPYVNDGHAAGGSFVPGRHMYELGLMQFEAQSDTLVDSFLKTIKGIGD